MTTMRLGKSELEPTRVVLGAWAFGGWMWGGQKEEDSIEAVEASLAAGIRAIDTAPVYGFGRSEETVGKAIRGRRDEVLIFSKCGLRWDRDDGELRFVSHGPDGSQQPVYYNLKPDSIREECEASLTRLGIDCIDLYQVHWPDPRHPLDDAFGEMVKLRDEGKVRYLGACNLSVEQLETARDAGFIVSCQPQYNLLDRSIESGILPWCRENEVGVIPYSPMGRGLLTGKISATHEYPPSDHRSKLPDFQPGRREAILAALAEIEPICLERGMTLGNLAVAWVLSQPGVTAALVGARNARQARENAAALEVCLDEREEHAIRRVFEALD